MALFNDNIYKVQYDFLNHGVTKMTVGLMGATFIGTGALISFGADFTAQLLFNDFNPQAAMENANWAGVATGGLGSGWTSVIARSIINSGVNISDNGGVKTIIDGSIGLKQFTLNTIFNLSFGIGGKAMDIALVNGGMPILNIANNYGSSTTFSIINKGINNTLVHGQAK